MKKRSLIFTSVLLASVFCLSGCFQPLDGPGMVNSEPVNPSSEVVSEVASDSGWEKPSSAPKEEVQTVSATQKGPAVIYDNKILFRGYSSDAMEYSALFGEFQNDSYQYNESGLYTYDGNAFADSAELLCKDNGYGDLYLSGNTLYSQTRKEIYDDNFNRSVYRTKLPDGTPEIICDGTMVDMSEDGKYIAVFNWVATPKYETTWSVYATDQISSPLYSRTIMADDDSLIFLGFAGDYGYFIQNDDEANFKILQYDNTGKCRTLSAFTIEGEEEDMMDYAYPEYHKTLAADNNNLEFYLDYFQGTGHFYYESVKVTTPLPSDFSESEEAVSTSILDFVELENDPSLTIVPDEKMKTNTNGRFANVVQYFYPTDNGTFYEIADCHRNPMGDIGWRTCFTFFNMRYVFVNKNGEEKEVLKMFEPLGQKSLWELDSSDTANTLFAYAKLIGEPGKAPTAMIYETIYVEGPESPIEESDVYYIAEISDDFKYEYPEEDIYEPFTIVDLEGFTNLMKDNKEIFLKDAPKSDVNETVEYNDSMSFENALCVHVGFDKDGKVNYLRPVIFD